MNVIRFKFTDRNGDNSFSFDCELFKNSFSEKWRKALEFEVRAGSQLREGLFFGAVFQNEEEIVRLMKQAMAVVNSWGRGGWFQITPKVDMSLAYLMQIHEEYEQTERMPAFREGLTDKIQNNLLLINELIHRYETIARKPNEFHINFIFNKPRNYPLLEEDFQLFTPHINDGWLYLDYATTGVTVLDAFNKNLPQRPVLQSTYQAGSKLLLDGDCQRTPEYLFELRNWLTERWGISCQEGRTPLGYIPLGRICQGIKRSEIKEQLQTYQYNPSIEIL